MGSGRVPAYVEKLQAKSGIKESARFLDGTESRELERVCLAHASVVNAQLKVDRQRTKILWILAGALSLPFLLGSVILASTIYGTQSDASPITALNQDSQRDHDQLQVDFRTTQEQLTAMTVQKDDLERKVRELQDQLVYKDEQIGKNEAFGRANSQLTDERDDLKRLLDEANRNLDIVRADNARLQNQDKPSSRPTTSPTTTSRGGR